MTDFVDLDYAFASAYQAAENEGADDEVAFDRACAAVEEVERLEDQLRVQPTEGG